MTIEGYDVSRWQTATPDLTNVGFAIVRACYGSSPDSRYAMHAANIRAAGKVLGAYLFARPSATGDTIEGQVEAFLATAADADLIAIDRERDGDAGTITATDTRRMISLIRATGRRVGLYASESSFRDLGQDWSWVAHWGVEPVIPWDVWQWDGGGTDGLDNDRFHGSLGALMALGAPLEGWVDARIAALEAELAATENLLATARQELDAAQVALGQAHESIASLTVEVDRLNGLIRAATERIAALGAQITAATAALDTHPAVRAHAILATDAGVIERLADAEGSPLP